MNRSWSAPALHPVSNRRRPLLLPASYKPVVRDARHEVEARDLARLARQEKAPRTLEWSLEVRHQAIKTLKVKLDASIHPTKVWSDGQKCCACGISVWAEGSSSESSAPTTLVSCKSSLMPGTSRVHVGWLGRKNASPQEMERHKSWRFVEDSSAQDQADTVSPKRKRTVAQAVLGLMAAIAGLYGMLTVELDAEDNGSGKLIKFYSDMGFRVVPNPPRKKGEDIPMCASLQAIAKLAPVEWLRAIIPQDFDPWGWLYQDMDQIQVKRILRSPDVPWKWHWRAAWPAGAKVDARMQVDRGAHKVSVEVTLSSRHDIELAFARGSIRFPQQSLRVIWVGRSKSKPVHPNVRGQKMYPVDRLQDMRGSVEASSHDDLEQDTGERVTAATAVLGALAALARWFGTTVVDLTATGDSTGKLLWYFTSIGFSEPSSGAPLHDCVPMTASCETLAERCCPPAWRTELPPDGELQFLTAICRKQYTS